MTDPTREPRPSNGLLDQKPLGTANIPVGTPSVEVELDFRLSTGGDNIEFFYRPIASGTLDLAIDDDVWIIIKLRSNKSWQWSTRYQAITTKKDRKSLYRNLRYIDQDGADIVWTDQLTGSFKAVKFHALCRKNLPSEGHGFSMNVEFPVSPGKNLMLPVTIDPDVINPRPPGSLIDIFSLEERVEDIPVFALGDSYEITPEN